MNKIKIFEQDDIDISKLEKNVNDFIKDKEVISIMHGVTYMDTVTFISITVWYKEASK